MVKQQFAYTKLALKILDLPQIVLKIGPQGLQISGNTQGQGQGGGQLYRYSCCITASLYYTYNTTNIHIHVHTYILYSPPEAVIVDQIFEAKTRLLKQAKRTFSVISSCLIHRLVQLDQKNPTECIMVLMVTQSMSRTHNGKQFLFPGKKSYL